MELDAGDLGQGQEPAGEVDEVVPIGLLNRLKTLDVGTEVSDYVTLLAVLGFEPIDGYRLSSELVAEGFFALPAAGQISR